MKVKIKIIKNNIIDNINKTYIRKATLENSSSKYLIILLNNKIFFLT